MDLPIPDTHCKKVIINPNHEIVIKTANDWFSKYLKINWKDNNSLISCACYMFPKCNDIDLLVVIAKAFTVVILIDDLLDKHPEQMDHWLKVIERSKAITADPREKVYELIINEMMEMPFAFSQKLRILDTFTMYVESYKYTSKIRNGEFIPTMTEFTGMRFTDSFMHLTFSMVEFDLGLNLSAKWHIDVFRDLHKRITEHIMVTNDIYSYKREMDNEDYPKYTFMALMRQNSNLSREEALQLAVKRVECIEREISVLITKVKSFADEIPDEYIDGIIALKDGNHYWSKVCKRYNDF